MTQMIFEQMIFEQMIFEQILQIDSGWGWIASGAEWVIGGLHHK